jgi:hypothetical protein
MGILVVGGRAPGAPEDLTKYVTVQNILGYINDYTVERYP